MDHKLFDKIAESMPKFNDDIVNGLAGKELRYVELYVDRIIKTAAADFPPELTYEGYKRCTPYEEYAEITRRSNNASTFDLARSDMYMVKYFFKFAGEDLDPRYIYLPFVTDAGIISIRGSVFSIAPVLADKAISVGTDNIFIPLNRDKLTFQRQIHHYYRDGERETVYVVWALMHHKSKSKRAGNRFAVRGRTTLAHYLFAKYGLTETFKRFCKATVVVGNSQTITEETHPTSDWVICQSTRLKPRGVRDKYYRASDIRLAIKRTDFDRVTSDLIGGFFYIVDHFPDRIEPEYVDETRLWVVLLGHFLFGSGGNEGKLAEDVLNHLRSLDGYIDNEARTYLRSDGVYCDDLYGLLMHIIETFNQRITHSGSQVASMWDKRLMILRYVLKDLTSAVNIFMFAVTAQKKKALTKVEANNLLRRHLKTNLVMGINRKHGEVSSVSCPGDNKYFKVTCQIIPQTDSSGGRGKSKATSSDPGKFLHASIAEAGSYNTMGKSEPTGRNKINPFVKIQEDGLIIRDPNKAELLDNTQRKFRR